jgi:hypothetical protein
LEEIAKDKMERTGKPMVVKLKPAKEVVDDIYNKMRKVYPKDSSTGEQVNVCLKTVGIYLGENSLNFFFTFATFFENISND